MKSILERLSLAVRERLLRRWGIPFNPYRVESGIVEFLPVGAPIVYVDVGASAGTFAHNIEQHYGIRRGVFIEPQPDRCAELRAKFPGPQYSVYQYALGDESKTCEMDVLRWDYSSSLLPVKRDLPNVTALVDLDVREKIDCRVVTLDEVMAEAHWDEPIDLLKVDVQGAELMVFRGAPETLARARFVYAEVSFTPLYEGSCVFSDVYEFLRSRGFRLLALREGFRGKDGELLQGDALFGH